MSRGPGRIQRAILDLVNAGEAAHPFDTTDDGASTIGPVGVPLGAVFKTVYGTHEPTRAQRVAVFRAVRILEGRDLIGTYQRRVCRLQPDETTRWVSWSETLRNWECSCRRQHLPTTAVGRPRTDDEEREVRQKMAAAMALLKALA